MPQEHLTLLGHTAGDAGEACTAPGLLGCPHATLRDTRPCLLLLACLHGPLGSAPRQSMCGTVCVGEGGGDGTGWLSKPCTPRGAGGGHDLTAAVTVQVVAGGGMGKGSRVLFQGWGWRREESSLTPCKWGDAGRDRASSYPLPWEDVGRG